MAAKALKQLFIQEVSGRVSFKPGTSGYIGILGWDWDATQSSPHVYINEPGTVEFTGYIGHDTSTGDDYFGPVGSSPDHPYQYIRLTARNGKYSLFYVSDVPANLTGGNQEFDRNQDEVRAKTTGSASLTPITFLNDQHTEAILTCGSDSVIVQRPDAFVADQRRESLGPWNGGDGYRYTLAGNAKGEDYDVHSAPGVGSAASPAGYQIASPIVTAALAKVYSKVPTALRTLGVADGAVPAATPQVVITPDSLIAAGSFGGSRKFLFVSAGAVSKGGDLLNAALTYAVSTEILYAYPALMNQLSDQQSLDRIALAVSGNNAALLIALLEAKQKELPGAVPAAAPSGPRTAPQQSKANPAVQAAMGRLLGKMPDPTDKMALAKAIMTSVSSGSTAAIEEFKTSHPAFAGDSDLKTVESAIDPHGVAVPEMPAGISSRKASPNQIIGGDHVPTDAHPADLLSAFSERSQAIRRSQP